MPIVFGEPTHMALVRVYDRDLIAPGDLVRWEGAPDWKYKPLSRDELDEWQRAAADPERVIETNLRTKDLLHRPLSAAEKAWQAEIQAQRYMPIRIA